tara:strand:+ start:19120 stop:21789 length:2670 start_codon:yes stop_codon:yes gene_type:complete
MEWRGSLLQEQFTAFQDVDLYYANENEKGAISISGSEINGRPFEVCDDCEFVRIPLANPLLPGDSATLQLDFQILLPEAHFNGTGYDGKVYRIINWLPRIAMLDSAGWHLNPVTYQNDLYQSFDEYHVTLSLDDDMVVVSNATLQTPGELSRLEQMRSSPFQERSTSPVKRKTLSFHHPGTTSLQFYISDQFYLFPVRDSVDLYITDSDPYIPSILKGLDQNVNDFLAGQIGDDFSRSYDLVILDEKEGEFQSDHVLSLEYPSSTFELASNLAHARAEQLFRYQMAPDGFKNVWLARGIPYFYKYEFIKTQYPEKKWLPFSNSFVGRFFELDEFDYAFQNQLLFLFLARQGLDQPMGTPADSLSRLNYEASAQGKTYLALSHLKEYAGERAFNRAMRKYYLENRGTQSKPQDLRKSISYYFYQDVSWFFDALVEQAPKNDYALLDVDHCPTVTTVTVENKGSAPTPYSLTGIKDDKVVITEWFPGHQGKKTVQMYHEDYDKVIINYHQTTPEFSQKNNSMRTHGLFKKAEPLRLQFFTSFENPRKTQLYWMPTANYNAYDQLLMGISLYNSNTFVNKPFEYVIGPEYSTGTGSITGYASALYNFIPEGGPFHRISTGIFGRYYHYDEDLAYTRLSPSVSFYFRRKYAESTVLQKMRLRGVSVERELPLLFEGIQNEISNASYTVLTTNYTYEDINVLNPVTLNVDFQYGDQFSRLSAEADLRWMLPNKRWLIWRQFAGVFLNNEYSQKGINGNYYSFGLSGTQDYLFDYTFIGRSEQSGIWSQQFFVTDGGFKSGTNVFSDQYILTSGLSVPIWTAFGVFGDIGLVDGKGPYWDYGVRVAVFTDFLEFYFPFANQDSNFLTQSAYYNSIRFVLNADFGKIMERIRRGYY